MSDHQGIVGTVKKDSPILATEFGGERRITINIDGACEPINPKGVATYAYVIRDGYEKIAENSGLAAEPYSENATNNVAEYTAYIRALENAKRLGLYGSIEVQSDSQLLVNQLNGNWKVKKPHLAVLYEQAIQLGKEFSSATIKWVPREQNTEADRLSKEQFVSY
ncbi:MAG TPA: ribonuclease HI, partial [Candidatus Bathyarchaeia archaeon]|nr:ribonuclease HI [Candidatus Bathyarchaeia archaeon]